MKMPAWWAPELALVIGIPAATVCGGILTLVLVTGDFSNDGEHENAQRTAQMQTADLEPDLAAARAGLSADLHVDRSRGEVRVSLPTPAGAGDELELNFVHSLQSGRDLHARLQRRDGAWFAALAPDAGSRWRVVLADREQHWRLVGTLPRGAATLSLKPALPSP